MHSHPVMLAGSVILLDVLLDEVSGELSRTLVTSTTKQVYFLFHLALVDWEPIET
jgi:hypothetical protein